jgi:hypothetical protein
LGVEVSSNISDLVRQVELLEDYEQSSQALMDVVHLEPAVGARLALNALASSAGDVHFRAFAFNMLYRADRQAAFDFIREKAATCEPQVFGSMLAEVADDVGLLGESQDLQRIVQLLLSMVRERRKNELGVIDGCIKTFLDIYDHARL